jgi:hypothetical protein
MLRRGIHDGRKSDFHTGAILNVASAYLSLKSFQNEATKLCYPSYNTIIDRSNLSRGELANALAELEEFSWITKKKRFGGSTFYTLCTPIVFQLDEDGEREGLAPDQTCPSEQQAASWLVRLKRKKRRRRTGWAETVKAEAARIEQEEAEWEEIPF